MRLKTKSKKHNAVFIVTVVILSLYAISMIVPVLWTLMTTIKLPEDYGANRNVLWLPSLGVTLNNFKTAYEYLKITPQGSDYEFYILDQFANSLLYSLGSACTITLSSLVMGYATARFRYRFSKVIYAFVLIALALPIVGSMPSEIAVAK